MYGLIGCYAGFSTDSLDMAPAQYKSWWNHGLGYFNQTQIVPNDNKAYQLGFDLGNGGMPKTLDALCNNLLKNIGNGTALLQGNKDGSLKDTSVCKPCKFNTKLTIHGGNNGPKYTPL